MIKISGIKTNSTNMVEYYTVNTILNKIVSWIDYMAVKAFLYKHKINLEAQPVDKLSC